MYSTLHQTSVWASPVFACTYTKAGNNIDEARYGITRNHNQPKQNSDKQIRLGVLPDISNMIV